MLTRPWPLSFLLRFGGELPNSYLALDVETSGFDLKRDVITEIGHCLVVDGQVTNRLNLVVDWRGHPIVSEDWLSERMNRLHDSMASQGVTCRQNWARMEAEGLKPDEVFGTYLELFKTLRQKETVFPFVGHNIQFDESMLHANLTGFGYARSFAFKDDEFFDTNALERWRQYLERLPLGATLQTFPDRRWLPTAQDTLRSYFKRVGRLGGSQIKSKLSEHLVPRYKFVERFGIDVTKAHTADHDAYIAHLLMQELRNAVAPWPAPEPAPTVAVLSEAARRPSVLLDVKRVRGQRST